MPNIHVASGIASVIVPIYFCFPKKNVPVDFKIQPLCSSSAQLTGFGSFFFLSKNRDLADYFWILKIFAVHFTNTVFVKRTSAKHFMHSKGGN